MAPSANMILAGVSLAAFFLLYFSLRSIHAEIETMRFEMSLVRQAQREVQVQTAELIELQIQESLALEKAQSEGANQGIARAGSLEKEEKEESVLIYYGGSRKGFWPSWAIELTAEHQFPGAPCPVKCRYTDNPAAQAHADAELHFCLGMSGKIDRTKISVFQCTEPFVKDDRKHLTFNPDLSLDDFDIAMTYDPMVSNLPMTFGVWPADKDTFCNVNTWVQEVVKVKTTKTAKNPSCFFAANCDTARTDFVKEMMQYTGVDSYGSCLNNVQDDLGSHQHNSFDLLVKRSSIHKFCLAFDKQQTVGYISERLSMAYRSGCVPVYWGAGDVDVYAPGEHSLIKASDFKGPKELAEYLNYLDKNDTAYEEYFAWKSKPLRKDYLDFIDHTHCAAICDLCVMVSDMKNEKW